MGMGDRTSHFLSQMCLIPCIIQSLNVPVKMKLYIWIVHFKEFVKSYKLLQKTQLFLTW